MCDGFCMMFKQNSLFSIATKHTWSHIQYPVYDMYLDSKYESRGKSKQSKNMILYIDRLCCRWFLFFFSFFRLIILRTPNASSKRLERFYTPMLEKFVCGVELFMLYLHARPICPCKWKFHLMWDKIQRFDSSSRDIFYSLFSSLRFVFRTCVFFLIPFFSVFFALVALVREC